MSQINKCQSKQTSCIHAGGNGIGWIKGGGGCYGAITKDAIYYMQALLPYTFIIWSCILPRIEWLFEDSCHLSFIGNDLFLNTFQGAFDTFINYPDVKIYPSDSYGGWFQLSGGGRVAALAVHPLVHWRKLKTTVSTSVEYWNIWLGVQTKV